jgi:hypothetical protein
MGFVYEGGRSNARYVVTGERRNGRDLYRVLDGFSYSAIVAPWPVPIGICIEPGFMTDLASIPSIPGMPNPAGSLWDDAAIVHDAAIVEAAKGNLSHRTADAIFYHALRDRGCNRFTAFIFWAAVRLRNLVR